MFHLEAVKCIITSPSDPSIPALPSLVDPLNEMFTPGNGT